MQLNCRHCDKFITSNFKNLESINGKAFVTLDDTNLNVKVTKYKINCCCFKSNPVGYSSYLLNTVCKDCKCELGWTIEMDDEIKYILFDKYLTTVRT